MSKHYEIGELIPVSVRRVLPFGLLVGLPDGREGLIRQRELSWRQDEDGEWRRRYRCGEQLEAVVLRERKRYLELSLRLTEHDPWIDIHKRYWLGQWVAGVVTGTANYGVFVQLEPGISGLLHKSQAPKGTDIEEAFWIGDHVHAAIAQIDLKRRRIGLTLAGLRQQRWQKNGSNENDGGPVIRKHHGDNSSEMPLPLAIVARQASKEILLVEDDRAQLNAVRRWLVNAGQRVTSAEEVESALAQMRSHTPEILLTDMRLPGKMSGIDLIRSVLEHENETRCVLMSDWGNIYQRWDELDDLRQSGVEVILKPIRPEELINMLAEKPGTNLLPTAAEQTLDEIVQISPANTAASGQRTLPRDLARARRQLAASKIALFELDPYNRQMQLVAEAGREPIRGAFLPDLIHSPVRDVAEDEQQVVIHDMKSAGAYATKLASVVDFGSCIGIPVLATDVGLYALFVFFKRPQSVTENVHEKTVAYALMVGALLKEQRLLEQSAEMQRVVLMGHMTSMLVHEINHHLTPMLLAVNILRERCQSAQDLVATHPQQMGQELEKAADLLRTLEVNITGITEQAELFGRLMVHETDAMHRMDRVIERAIALVGDQARSARVTIVCSPIEQLMITRLRANDTLQILLNILLNAIQQIAFMRPHEGGRIMLQTDLVTVNKQTSIRILVEDDGPGIHRRHWARIFELGFTTRKGEGSGLGLYLTRQLLRNMGGDVSVLESQALWGSTIEITLPVSIG